MGMRLRNRIKRILSSKNKERRFALRIETLKIEAEVLRERLIGLVKDR